MLALIIQDNLRFLIFWPLFTWHIKYRFQTCLLSFSQADINSERIYWNFNAGQTWCLRNQKNKQDVPSSIDIYSSILPCDTWYIDPMCSPSFGQS